MTGLGPLESALMEALWQTGAPMTVRQVCEAMTHHHRRRDYSTASAALMVLHSKGLVRRTKVNRAWLYWSRTTRAEHIADRVHGLLADAGSARSGVIALLVRQCTALDRDDLRVALAEVEDGALPAGPDSADAVGAGSAAPEGGR
ncbi:putative transcriptional regulator [Murinocardiopsis flavida]|uniref:Putative transcriptional regulator n=1 Tax=Murinocardiopsis flavida TaxID=645275 RepID=A0A2P8CY53_9ACTN|nr:BlaI/MecI/CopY family transcriptional regulator [Murinocardiopsis flavida]PSK89911.1 putative transcriptional regulator [Murinocardiopsis flavida]